MRLFVLFVLFLPLIVNNQPQGQQTLVECSASVHSKYTALGPDNQKYATWHAQIDFNNNCYHNHEHGSSPHLLWQSNLAYAPLYGYTMPTEAHNGFKTFVVDLDSNHRAMITMHFGTANVVNAICNRFHTFDTIIVDSNTGELLANTHMMGDFGKPVINEAPTIVLKNSCVDPAIGSNGVRQFPVASAPYTNAGYEPWRLHRDHNNPNVNPFGFDSAAVIVNTRNPKTACNDITCTVALQRIDPYFNTQSNGSWRTIEFPYNSFGFTGVVSGTFVVDGLTQYIKPNWSLRSSPTLRCWPIDPFVYSYACKNRAVDAAPFYRNFFITGNN